MVYLYTDGACHVKQSIGGFSYLIVKNGIIYKHYSQQVLKTTNNRMELSAVIYGLQSIYDDNNLNDVKEINVVSDSSYVVFAINKGWLNKWKEDNYVNRLNSDLWHQLDKLIRLRKINFIWVRGHNGNQYNELCDKLAVAASNK